MDVYLPIANLSVNAFVIVLLGGGVGILSGMFGVGGGFLTTPLLIVYGIPPTVAAATSASQVTGSSVRSEEHTSELQSLMCISYAVFCLKKKNKIIQHIYN